MGKTKPKQNTSHHHGKCLISYVSPECLPRSLRGRWWFLRGVLVVLDIMDVPNIHPGRSVSIFRALAAWEVPNLLCVSRKSSWSLRGRSWLLWIGVVVGNAFYMHKLQLSFWWRCSWRSNKNTPRGGWFFFILLRKFTLCMVVNSRERWAACLGRSCGCPWES